MATSAFHTYLNSYTFVVICHELRILINIGCPWSVSSWLCGITSLLVRQKTKTEKAYVVDWRELKEHSAIKQKNAFKRMNNIFIPSAAQFPHCIIYFVSSLPTPGTTDMKRCSSFNKNCTRLKPRFKNHRYSNCPTPSNAKFKGKDMRED